MTLKQFLERIIKKHQKTLLLQNRTFTVEHKPQTSYFDITFRYPYLDQTISYSDRVIEDYKKGKRKYIEGAVIHELCHAITDELYSKAQSRHVTKEEMEDAREHVTDHMSNIIISLIK